MMAENCERKYRWRKIQEMQGLYSAFDEATKGLRLGLLELSAGRQSE
jgi:hypothetical protein